MVKLVVLYGRPDDPAAFDAYYAGTHVGLVDKLPGLRRFEHGKVTGSPEGPPPPYYYLAELSFDDEDALEAALSGPEGQAARDDVPTFASGGATMMIADA